MSHVIQTVRLTADNIETVFRPGDVFTDDREFGVIRTAFPMADTGSEAVGFVVTDRDSDYFGLPQTVRLTRVAI